MRMEEIFTKCSYVEWLADSPFIQLDVDLAAQLSRSKPLTTALRPSQSFISK